MPGQSPRPWMRGPEACQILCVSMRTLRRLVQEDRIGTLNVPGVKKTLFSRVDVEMLLADGTRTAKGRELVEA